MSDWTGPFPSDEEIAQRWTRDSLNRASSSLGIRAYQSAMMRRLFAFGDDDDPDPNNPTVIRARDGDAFDLLGAINGYRQAPATITIADLRAAMDANRPGGRPSIEVTAEEWAALGNVEPRDWPRVYGLPTDLGGVRVVVVDITDVRRRQAEMDALLGD